MNKYFLTVDWCNKGNRGVFCDRDGNCFSKDTEHTEDEMWDILDCFSIILNPESLLFSEEDIKCYTRWYPLAEYSNRFGVAFSPKTLERKEEK